MKKYQTLFNVLTLLLVCFAGVSSWQIQKLAKKWTKAKKIHKVNVNAHGDCKIWESLISKYPVTEKKPLVVVIASYNNETVCERNLWSVFDQTYDNYRVIYIDDCSTDNTHAKVQNFIQERGQENRVTLIRNPKRKLKLPNLYHAYQMCQNHEIVVCLDGDDWLAHENVFKEINHYYQNPDVWLTYGSAINHPQFIKQDGKCLSDNVLLSNSIRDVHFSISMLRTFYAGLFKQIHLKDLFYQGKFLPSADDFAFMVPMIEMAPTHSLFIPDILYVINDSNPIRENCVIESLQIKLMRYLQAKEKYTPLKTTFDPRNTNTLANILPLDLIVISEDNPLFLSTALENYLSTLSPLGNLYVLYRASTPELQAAYTELDNSFSTVSFIQDHQLSIKSLLETWSFQSTKSSPYILIATDAFLIKDKIDLMHCIREMETTGAVNFFLGHLADSLPGVPLKENLSAISLETLAKVPALHTDSTIAIFQKQRLIEALSSPAHPPTLIQTICLSTKNQNDVALFYPQPKVIPLQSLIASSNKLALLHQYQVASHKMEKGGLVQNAPFAYSVKPQKEFSTP